MTGGDGGSVDFWISVTVGHRGGRGESAEIFSKELCLIQVKFSQEIFICGYVAVTAGHRGRGSVRFFRIFRSRGFWTIPKGCCEKRCSLIQILTLVLQFLVRIILLALSASRQLKAAQSVNLTCFKNNGTNTVPLVFNQSQEQFPPLYCWFWKMSRGYRYMSHDVIYVHIHMQKLLRNRFYAM